MYMCKPQQPLLLVMFILSGILFSILKLEYFFFENASDMQLSSQYICAFRLLNNVYKHITLITTEPEYHAMPF